MAANNTWRHFLVQQSGASRRKENVQESEFKSDRKRKQLVYAVVYCTGLVWQAAVL